MKNRKINFIKLGIIFFGISLLLWNCNEEDNLHPTNNYNNIKITTTSLNEINLDNNLKTTINSFKSVLDISKTYNKPSKNSNRITILTDSIVKIESQFATSYTFRILTPTSASSDFENFIIETKNDTTQLYIWRYNHTFNNENYSFSISRLNVDSETLNNANIEYQRNSNYSKSMYIVYDPATGCYYDVHESGAIGLIGCESGSSGGGSSEGGSSDGNNTSGGFSGNNGGYFGDSNDPDSNNGSGGSGSGTTSNTSNSNTSYSVPLFIPYEEQIIDCLGSYILNNGNTTVDAWLNDPTTNPVEIKRVASFLKASSSNNNDPYNSNTETNCNNPEAIEFIVKAIEEALINDGEVDFDDRIIDEIENIKIKCLNDKLTKNGNTFVKDLLANFNGNSEFDINIKSVQNIFSDKRQQYVNGQTIHVPGETLINIKISTDKISTASVLSGIRTILHEYIHADIYRKLNTKDDANQDEVKDFKDTYEKYEREEHHNSIASIYINSMTKSLKDIHKKILPREYDYFVDGWGADTLDDLYESLAWQGLKNHKLDAWENLGSDTTRINNTLSLHSHRLTPNCP